MTGAMETHRTKKNQQNKQIKQLKFTVSGLLFGKTEWEQL